MVCCTVLYPVCWSPTGAAINNKKCESTEFAFKETLGFFTLACDVEVGNSVRILFLGVNTIGSGWRQDGRSQMLGSKLQYFYRYMASPTPYKRQQTVSWSLENVNECNNTWTSFLLQVHGQPNIRERSTHERAPSDLANTHTRKGKCCQSVAALLLLLHATLFFWQKSGKQRIQFMYVTIPRINNSLHNAKKN